MIDTIEFSSGEGDMFKKHTALKIINVLVDEDVNWLCEELDIIKGLSISPSFVSGLRRRKSTSFLLRFRVDGRLSTMLRNNKMLYGVRN